MVMPNGLLDAAREVVVANSPQSIATAILVLKDELEAVRVCSLTNSIAEFAKSTPTVRYRHLNSFLWEGENLLNSLLPPGHERAVLCIKFQLMHHRIHELLLDEIGSHVDGKVL